MQSLPTPRAAAPLGELPPARGAVRWTASRKLGVLSAVDSGLLTLEEACRRYSLTADEIEEWRHGFRQHGTAGLKTTTLQERRRRSRGSAR